MAFQDVGIRLVVMGVGKFERDVNRASSSIDRLTRNVGRSANPLDRMSAGFSKLGGIFTNFGSLLTTSVTIPLAAAVTGLITAGISFEDAFAGVSKTVDGVADDFGNLTTVGEELRKEMIDLSLEIPISANELARVAQAAGQVGVSADNILEFTKIAAGMGVATDIASDQAAISLARLANILGISEEEFVEWATSASAAVVDLGNNVAATESHIMNMALRIAPAGSVVGLTTQEILALSASLAEVGVASERGGTAISRIFYEMAEASGSVTAATGEMKDGLSNVQPELNQLRNLINSGVTDLDDLKFQLRGTSLNLDGIGGILDSLGRDDGAFASVNHQIAKTNITMQGYQRTLSEIDRDMEELQKQLDKGSITQEQYNTKAQALRDRQADVNDAIARTNITLSGYNDRLGELNSEITTVDDVIKRVSQNTLMDLEGALEDGTSKVAIFADIMGVSRENFAAAFGAKPLETFQRFLVELAKLQDAGKISAETLTELGLGGVRVREILNILGPNMESVTENVNRSNKAWIDQTALQIELQKKFATTKTQIQLVKNQLVALGIAIFDVLKPSLDSIFKSLQDTIGGFTKFIETNETGRKALGKLVAVLILLGPALTLVGTALRGVGLLFSGLSGLLSIISGAFSAVMFIFANPLLLFGIAAFVGAIILIKNNVGGLGDLFSRLIDWVDWLTVSLRKNPIFTGALEDAFRFFVDGDLDSAWDSIKIAWAEFSNWFSNLFIPILKSEWERLKNIIIDKLKLLGKAFVEWVKDIWGDLKKKLNKLLTRIKNWIGQKKDTILDKLDDWKDAFVDWAKEIWQDLKTTNFADLIGYILGWIVGKALSIAGKLLEWIARFVNWAVEVWPQLKLKLSGLLVKMLLWIISSSFTLKRTVEDNWIPAFKDWVKRVGPLLLLDLSRLIARISMWIKYDAKNTLIASFLSIIDAFIDVGRDIGKGFLRGLAEGIGLPEESIFILESLDELAGLTLDTFKNLLDQGSPSKKAMEIGANFTKGFALGILQEKAKLFDSLETIGMGSVQVLSDATLAGVLGGTMAGDSTTNYTNNTTFAPTINGVPMQDERSAGNELVRSWRMAQVTGNVL